MSILRERQVWRKARKPDQGRRPSARIDRLAPEQEASVRAWLRVLHARLGRWRDVAEALNISLKSVERVIGETRRPTAGWALRVARAAEAPVDDVLGRGEGGELPAVRRH